VFVSLSCHLTTAMFFEHMYHNFASVAFECGLSSSFGTPASSFFRVLGSRPYERHQFGSNNRMGSIHVCGACPAAYERGWEHSIRARGGAGAVRCWLALTLCMRMYFNQTVLGHLGIDRPLRAYPTIRAGPYNRDKRRWMGACSVCMPRVRARG
jgi:hypothetical protein